MNSEKQYVVEQLENLKGLHITAEELNNKLSAIFGVERVKFNDYGLDDPFEKLIFTIDIDDNSEIAFIISSNVAIDPDLETVPPASIMAASNLFFPLLTD